MKHPSKQIFLTVKIDHAQDLLDIETRQADQGLRRQVQESLCYTSDPAERERYEKVLKRLNETLDPPAWWFEIFPEDRT